MITLLHQLKQQTYPFTNFKKHQVLLQKGIKLEILKATIKTAKITVKGHTHSLTHTLGV